MDEPDLFEGDDEMRRLVCDHAGHDWDPVPDWSGAQGSVCLQCGAMTTAVLGGEES